MQWRLRVTQRPALSRSGEMVDSIDCASFGGNIDTLPILPIVTQKLFAVRMMLPEKHKLSIIFLGSRGSYGTTIECPYPLEQTGHKEVGVASCRVESSLLSQPLDFVGV